MNDNCLAERALLCCKLLHCVARCSGFMVHVRLVIHTRSGAAADAAAVGALLSNCGLSCPCVLNAVTSNSGPQGVLLLHHDMRNVVQQECTTCGLWCLIGKGMYGG